jgi:hypothetical protein
VQYITNGSNASLPVTNHHRTVLPRPGNPIRPD